MKELGQPAVEKEREAAEKAKEPEVFTCKFAPASTQTHAAVKATARRTLGLQ
jgi:hypothetical protein